MDINRIYNEECLVTLGRLPDRSIDCCVTSPPYYGLRDYGHSDQIGLEETPEAYVQKLVDVFREVRRVLKDEGTLWLNLGDSYCSTAGGTMGDSLKQAGILSGVSNDRAEASKKFRPKVPFGLKPKDLIGIPWMVAFALRSDGWYLRQDIIWHKPNPMPESVTDRCTKSHEYIFLLSKSQRYFYDYEAIKEPMKASSISRLNQDVEGQNGSDRVPGKTNGAMKSVGMYVGGKKHKNMQDKGQPVHSFHATRNNNGQEWQNADGKANKRSVWAVNTKPYKEAHFATYPPELIVPCVKAGCPVGGVVYYPFGGSGTTGEVAIRLGRNFILSEINPDYCKIAERRLRKFTVESLF